MEQINLLTEKIKAIKAVRTWTLETFSTASGLKISKDFIEALIAQREKAVSGDMETLQVVRQALGVLSGSPRTRANFDANDAVSSLLKAQQTLVEKLILAEVPPETIGPDVYVEPTLW